MSARRAGRRCRRSDGAGAGDAVSVLVVDLGDVTSCDPVVLDVLEVATQRARCVNVGLHVVDRGQPTMRRLLADASSRSAEVLGVR